MAHIKLLLLSLLAVFAPVQQAVLAVLVLCGVDLLTGLLAAFRSKEPITSSGLKRTVIKSIAYPSAILLGHLTQQYLTGSDVPITKIVSGYCGLVELKSILENMDIILGGNTFTILITRLQKLMGGE